MALPTGTNPPKLPPNVMVDPTQIMITLNPPDSVVCALQDKLYALLDEIKDYTEVIQEMQSQLQDQVSARDLVFNQLKEIAAYIDTVSDEGTDSYVDIAAAKLEKLGLFWPGVDLETEG